MQKLHGWQQRNTPTKGLMKTKTSVPAYTSKYMHYEELFK